MLESREMQRSTLDEGRLRRLLDVGRSLVSTLDLDAILEELLRTACEVTGARYAAIGVLDSERKGLERFITRGIDGEQRRAIGDLPRGRGVLGVLIEDPRPLRLADVSEHPSSYGFPAHHPPMKSFLGVPVLVRGSAWGNLYLTEKEGGDFGEDDEQAMLVLAQWAGIAIDNARLYREARRRSEEAERAVRNFEATIAIARAVGSEIDIDRVLELVVKRGRALVDARAVVLLLVFGERLEVAAAAGQVAGGALGAAVPLEGSAIGEILHSRRPERISDVSVRLRIPDQGVGVIGAETALLVPLIYRGTALGVIAAFDKLAEDSAFGGEDERLLESFASSAATAVATARTVAEDRLRHSLMAAEQERRRWARELHDGTLQGLGGLRVLLAGGLRSGDAGRLEQIAGEAVNQLTEQIEGLRNLITELRPAALDDIGLAPALETLCERVATVQGLDLEANIELGRRLHPDVETAVYRIVQEALTNVGKHARAQHVRVSVREAEDGRVLAEVVDDGVGYDNKAAGGGFGLVGIRERVGLAGGSLEIRSEAGKGTAVRAALPPDGSA